MVDVMQQVAAWEHRQAGLSDELQRFLDLVWSHRKDQKTKSYSALNADVYALYARASRHSGIRATAIVEFLNGILTMPQLPEIQCDLSARASRDPLGNYLKEVIFANRATSGFAELTLEKFKQLVNDAKTNTMLQTELAQTFYHFRRSRSHSSERIYLHVKPLQALQVMKFIDSKMVRQPGVHPGVLNAKVGAPGALSRFDTIVIYLSNATAVGKALDEIAAYQRAGNRDRFESGTTRSTKHITYHNGIELIGVGTGAEPPVDIILHQQRLVMVPGSSSFGSFRSMLIEYALQNTLQHQQGKSEFVNRVIGYFRSAGINPQQPYTHGMQVELRHRAKVTLDQLRQRKEPTWKIP